MPATVYGKPAVEVQQPDGELVAYLVLPVVADESEWRAWLVTSPKGETHRVSELPDGGCKCSCPAWKYNRHAAGRWCEANGVPVCKHAGAIWNEIIRPAMEISA